MNISNEEAVFDKQSPIQVPIVQLDFSVSPVGNEDGEFLQVKNKKKQKAASGIITRAKQKKKWGWSPHPLVKSNDKYPSMEY